MARPPALLHLASTPSPFSRVASFAPPAARSSPLSSARSLSTAAASRPTVCRTTQKGSAAGATAPCSARPAQRKTTGARSFHSSSRALAKNPYSVLGVGKDDKTADIKKAYYQLAKKYHPDSSKEKDAKEKFVEIQEAYDTLSDDKKRADFDRFGAASQQSGFDSDAYARATSSFGGAGFGDFFNGGMGGGGPGGPSGADIFDSLFGAFGRGGSAGPRQAAPPVGDDIEISVTVPFIDAAKGASRTVPISPVVDCHTCHGSGLKEGMQKKTCGSCGGTGTRTFTIQSGFQMASTCSSCGGSGSVAPPGSNCGTCAGVGKVRERTTVEVKIPPGVDDGMRIRLDGKGDAPLSAAPGSGAKGRNGDLYVRIHVQPSKVFTRQGSNLYQNISVPFYTAILGGRAPVKTLDRDVEVRVPQGTQPGEEMVLRGRGVKKLYKEEHGDLVIKFNVTMPRSLTPIQRLILEQYVAETDMPGSTSHYPNPASPAAKASPPPPPSSSTKKSQEPSKPVEDDKQAAQPPPTDRSSKSSWWTTMSDDISSTAPPPSSSSPPSPSPAPSKPSPTPAAESAKAEKKAEAEAKKKEDDSISLKDLWKAGKNKIKKVKEEMKEKVGCDEPAKEDVEKEKKQEKK